MYRLGTASSLSQLQILIITLIAVVQDLDIGHNFISLVSTICYTFWSQIMKLIFIITCINAYCSIEYLHICTLFVTKHIAVNNK